MHENYTYGELLESELKKIISSINGQLPEAFIDLGCGKGNICHEAAKIDIFKKVYGIELLPQRLARALKIKNKKVQFFLANLEKNLPKARYRTLAYICATCFEYSLLEKIAHNLSLDDGYQYVASLKPLPLTSAQWQRPQVFFVECSWDSSPCYLYQRYQ